LLGDGIDLLRSRSILHKMEMEPLERLSEVLEARRKRCEHMTKVIEARNNLLMKRGEQIDRMRVMIMVLGVVQVLMLAMVFVCPLC
jgi:hypothetical protein